MAKQPKTSSKKNRWPKDIWVVMPAYNEARYVSRVLDKTLKVTSNVVFVDDGSRDKTFEIAQSKIPHSLRHISNLGKGAALKTGTEYAFDLLKAKAVIFMDSDDQHDPKELYTFVEALANHQVIFGVRQFNTDMPLVRIMGNRFSSFLTYLLFGRYILDIPSGFKAIAAQAYPQVRWNATDYSVEMEIAARVAKYNVPFTSVQISTIYHDMDRGMSFLDILHVLKNMISWKVSL